MKCSIFLSLLLASAGLAAEPPLEIAIQRGHRVTTAVLSGDGRFVLTAGGDSAILWDAATGKMLQRFRGHERFSEVRCVAISADGKIVVTGASDENAIVWDGGNGKKLQALAGNKAAGTSCLALTPDGKSLVAGTSGQYAYHWDLEAGKKLQTYALGANTYIRAAAISDDAKTIALVRESDASAIICDAATGKTVKALSGHKTYVRSVSLSADGKRAATGSYDNTAAVWDVASGKKLQSSFGTGMTVLTGTSAESKYVASASLSADAKQLFVAATDGTVALRATSNGNRLKGFKDASGSINDACVSDDGRFALLTTGFHRTPAALWDLGSGKRVQTFMGHTEPLTSIALSADGKALVAGTNEHYSVVWDLVGGKLARTLDGSSRFAALNETGTRAVTANQSNVVHWDVTTGKKLKNYEVSKDDFTSLAINGAGTRAVVGSKTGTASQWLASPVTFQKEHVAEVTSTALSRDGAKLVTGSLDGTAVLWNATSGKKIFAMKPPVAGGLVPPIFSVTISDDGTRIATGRFGGDTLVWDAANGDLLQSLPGPAVPVKFATFSSDGKLLATGAGFNAQLWDLASGKTLVTCDLGKAVRNAMFKPNSAELKRALDEHGVGFISGVAISPDRKHLFTSSEDYSGVRLWDAKSGQERGRLLCFDGGLNWLVVTPDGFFDGTPGAWIYVAHRTPGTQTVIDDEAVKKRMHRPGLLTQLLEGKP